LHGVDAAAVRELADEQLEADQASDRIAGQAKRRRSFAAVHPLRLGVLG
jgi:hypothetical protein